MQGQTKVERGQCIQAPEITVSPTTCYKYQTVHRVSPDFQSSHHRYWEPVSEALGWWCGSGVLGGTEDLPCGHDGGVVGGNTMWWYRLVADGM